MTPVSNTIDEVAALIANAEHINIYTHSHNSIPRRCFAAGYSPAASSLRATTIWNGRYGRRSDRPSATCPSSSPTRVWSPTCPRSSPSSPSETCRACSSARPRRSGSTPRSTITSTSATLNGPRTASPSSPAASRSNTCSMRSSAARSRMIGTARWPRSPAPSPTPSSTPGPHRFPGAPNDMEFLDSPQ